MEPDEMGRAVTEATIENLQDLWDAETNAVFAFRFDPISAMRHERPTALSLESKGE